MGYTPTARWGEALPPRLGVPKETAARRRRPLPIAHARRSHEFAIPAFPGNSGGRDSPTWVANTWEEEEAPGWSGTLWLQSRRPASTFSRPVATGMAVIPFREDSTRPRGRDRSSGPWKMAPNSGTV